MYIYYYFSPSLHLPLFVFLHFVYSQVCQHLFPVHFYSSQYFTLDNFNCSGMVSLLIFSKSHTFCQFPSFFSFCFLLSTLFASFSIKGVIKLLSSSLPSPLHMFMWSCQPFFSPSQCLVDFVLCVLVILFDPPCPFLSLLPSF